MGGRDEIPFEIDVHQLRAWLDEGRELAVLDVREPEEHQICRIEGSRLVPLRELPERLDDLDRETLTVVHCHHGPRSAHAVAYLRRQGFSRATNLGGGIDAWSLYIDPAVPRY
jgi:rhodanese-related sulfurtransferase